MKTEFNHAANDSPRSGSSKQITPLVWFVVIALIVAMAIWFNVGDDFGLQRSTAEQYFTAGIALS